MFLLLGALWTRSCSTRRGGPSSPTRSARPEPLESMTLTSAAPSWTRAAEGPLEQSRRERKAASAMTRLWAAGVCRLQVIFSEILLGQRERGFREASTHTHTHTYTHTHTHTHTHTLAKPPSAPAGTPIGLPLSPEHAWPQRDPRTLSFSLQTPSASQLLPPCSGSASLPPPRVRRPLGCRAGVGTGLGWWGAGRGEAWKGWEGGGGGQSGRALAGGLRPAPTPSLCVLLPGWT